MFIFRPNVIFYFIKNYNAHFFLLTLDIFAKKNKKKQVAVENHRFKSLSRPWSL
jgi:hypothetical protein